MERRRSLARPPARFLPFLELPSRDLRELAQNPCYSRQDTRFDGKHNRRLKLTQEKPAKRQVEQ